MKFTFYHNNINVADLDKSIEFYKKALGLKITKETEAADGSFKLVFMGDDTTPHKLELTWLRDMDRPYDLGDNEIHLAMQTDDMAAALEAGKVARYVSDFPNPKVVHMKHVILTPHLGASTRESEDNCAVMAVQEITDYLENGNIKNSVNYPACDMGVCQAASRIAVLHMNIPNMIGQITAILAAQGVNISDMTNKSRDKYAYTLLDLEHKPEETTVEKLKAIEGVLRVRVVK